MNQGFRTTTIFFGVGLGLIVSACGGKTSSDGSVTGNVDVSVGGTSSGEATAAGGTFASDTGTSTGGAAATGGAFASDTDTSTGGATATGGTSASDTGTSAAPDCIIRVAQTGLDSNSGSNWGEALKTVQQALDNASQWIDDVVCSTVDIWVAAGEYTPTRRATQGGNATFQLVPHVALYGGFAGTESSLASRDYAAHTSILSGENNSYHVVIGVTGATLDGFTITGGNAQVETHNYNAPASNAVGGGIYNESASPTVANCTFTKNKASSGGGIYNIDSSPTVTNCVFTENQGGAMVNRDSSPTVANCTFSNNSGSGMNNSGGLPIVTNCTFAGNSGDMRYFDANRGEQYGGGMKNSSSSPIVTNCAFIGNSVSIGGSVAGFGGGIYNDNSSPMVLNCTFTNNRAYLGGGIYSQNGSPIVTNSILWGDTNGTDISEIVAYDAATVTYSIVQGGYATGENIINADPLFVDAPNGNLHLSAGSPAIDAADSCARHVTLTDLDGSSRWDIAGVPNATHGMDIGAYEYQGTPETDIGASSCN